MKYGCIGEKLKHSFSKEIHNAICDYEYEIREIPRDELDAFMREADFHGINVTIPYKELVIPYLDIIDEHAKIIGAVNTVVKREGKLYGYNTDFSGMTALIKHIGIDLVGKKVAILGTGGTSKTARAVSESLGASEILVVSRRADDGNINYDTLVCEHTDVEVIINTTPLGMFPNNYTKPLELSVFPALSGVVDAVYNPLRTPLVSEAIARDIPSLGGLYMLVSQAVSASEIFLDKKYEQDVTDRVFKKILREKENIVLIGMPASGKSTVAEILRARLGRKKYDTDDFIVDRAGISIPEIFGQYGEAHFRAIEHEVALEVAKVSSAVIATGGGIILNPENVKALKQNGRVYFIDRPLEDLVPTDSRPLSSDRASIEKRYAERYDIYKASADVIIDADCDAVSVAEKIMEDFQN